MKANRNGNWKGLLLIGAVAFIVLLFFGWVVSAGFALLATIVKGVGVLLGSLFRYAFSSPVNLLIVGALGYGGYKLYKRYFSRGPDRIDYTDSDFERGEEGHYEPR